jgi:sugar phosphate isomerase/epimerase
LTRCLEIATELDAPMVRVFGFWPEEGDQARVTAEVVSRLRDVTAQASERGITLALENCPHTLLDRTGKVLDVLEAVGSPRLRLLWDPSNAWRCGDRDLLSLADRAIPHLAHMHVKGIRLDDRFGEGRSYVALDEGHVDYLRLLAKLAESGYQGVVSLEPHYALPRSGREGAARESFAGLTRLLPRMPPTADASP